MLFADGTVALILLGVWIFCVIDVITTPESDVRNLPKLTWVFIVLLFPDIGSLAWLVAGRTWQPRPAADTTSQRATPAAPDDDEQFLQQVRERAEAQRREYQQRRAGELDEKHDPLRKRPETET